MNNRMLGRYNGHKEQWSNEERIKKAAAKFPEIFGLRGFPAGTFRISLRSSYVDGNGEIQLYTQSLQNNGQWLDFAKGTEEELLREIVEKKS